MGSTPDSLQTRLLVLNHSDLRQALQLKARGNESRRVAGSMLRANARGRDEDPNDMLFTRDDVIGPKITEESLAKCEAL